MQSATNRKKKQKNVKISLKPSALSPIALTARATPTNPLAVDYRLEYDPNAVDDNPKLLGMSLNGTLRSPDLNVSGGWSRQAFAQRTQTGAVIEARNLLQTQADFRVSQSPFPRTSGRSRRW